MPSKHLSLEDLERRRNLKREDMEYVNENGYEVKLVRNPGLCVMMDMFYRIMMSDINDTKLTMICPNPWAIRYVSLVEMINKFGINMRNVHAFAMDEFADEDGNVCPNTYAPGLGYSFMNNFYGRIREDLRPDVSQWHTFSNDVKARVNSVLRVKTTWRTNANHVNFRRRQHFKIVVKRLNASFLSKFFSKLELVVSNPYQGCVINMANSVSMHRRYQSAP